MRCQMCSALINLTGDSRMTRFLRLSVTVALGFFCQTSFAADGAKTYTAVCVSCHSTGALDSPKVGDRAKWAPLIKEGQTILTAHGYVGLRNMPPKGGKADLAIEDFAAALVYMVNMSGGKWKEPDAKSIAAIKIEIGKRQQELAREAAKKGAKK